MLLCLRGLEARAQDWSPESSTTVTALTVKRPTVSGSVPLDGFSVAASLSEPSARVVTVLISGLARRKPAIDSQSKRLNR
jgi:hypothetical protein